jgi:hypothetical protein
VANGEEDCQEGRKAKEEIFSELSIAGWHM